MKKLPLIGILLLVAGPALADTIAEKTGVNSALGLAPNTGDFVRDAAISDMFEIQASKLAEDHATSDATKKFAAEMVADHEKTSMELKALVTGGSVQANLPTALDNSHQKLLDTLKAESASDFDATYDSQQVKAHKAAVSMFKRYAKAGDNAGLKDWAGKTLPTLRDHLKMAKGLSA